MFFGDKYGAFVNVVGFWFVLARVLRWYACCELRQRSACSNSRASPALQAASEESEAVTGRGIEQWLLAEEKKLLGTQPRAAIQFLLKNKKSSKKHLTKLRLLFSSRGDSQKTLRLLQKFWMARVFELFHQQIFYTGCCRNFNRSAKMLREEMKQSAIAVMGAGNLRRRQGIAGSDSLG